MKRTVGFLSVIIFVSALLLIGVTVFAVQAETAYADTDIAFSTQPGETISNYTAGAYGAALFCSATANPSEGRTILYTWYRKEENGDVVVGTGDSCIVCTQATESGMYYCVASVVDPDDGETYVEQSNSVFAGVYPTLNGLGVARTGYPGEIVLDATPQLEDAALPNVQYAWHRSGEAEVLGTDATYTVLETGDYYCNVSYAWRYWNDGSYATKEWRTWSGGGFMDGSDTNTVTVTVESFDVPTIVGGSTDYGGEVALDATMSPSYGVDFTYAWYRSGETDPVGTDPVLIVNKPADSGLYRCLVSYEDASWSQYTNEVTVTVYKIRLDLTIDDKTVAYGDAEAPLTYTRVSGLVPGDTDEELASTITLTREEGADAGTYRVTGASNNDKYAVRFTDGTYTIERKKLDVRVVSVSVRYGDSEKNLSCQPEGELASGDQVSDLAIELTRQSGTDAGRYAITGTYRNDNYDLTFLPATYTILPREIQVNLIGCDHLVYDGTSPVITCELIAPPAGADLGAMVTFNKAVKNAGDYVASIRFADKNYAPYVSEYAFSVAKAPLSVGLEKTVVKRDGTVSPKFVYRGFIGKEDESVLTTQPTVDVDVSRVGVYEVMPYGASAQNYEISYVSGTIQVDYEGTETEFGSVTGLFSPEREVALSEGGDAKAGILSVNVFGCTVTGVADDTYTATVYGVAKYPKLFLRAAVVDEEGVRKEVKSFGYVGEDFVFSSDYAGTFVLYYDLTAPAVVAALLILLVLILIGVRRKDKKRERRLHRRQAIARQYVDRVVPNQRDEYED